MATKVDKINEHLEEFDKKLGIPPSDVGIISEVNIYLNLNAAKIKSMSGYDCCEGAAVLSDFAFHLQRAYNIENAKVNFLDAEINKTIAPEIDKYTGYGFAEKRIKAVAGNDYTKQLNEELKYHKVRADYLFFLAQRVKDKSDIFMEVFKVKRQTNG